MVNRDTRLYMVKSALYFDGSDDNVNIGDLGIAANGPGTVSGWFYQTTTADTRSAHIYYTTDAFYQHSANDKVYINGTNDYFSVEPAINQWNHLCMTWDGDTSTALFYYNGTQVAVSIQTGAETVGALNVFRIGAISNSLPGYATNVRIYNVELTSTEVNDLYMNKNITRGLKAHYKFRDGSGTELEDSVGTYDGTINGCTWSDMWVDCYATRWDTSDYTTTFETFLNARDLNCLRDNITPGAVGELYKILGKPTYYDKTWTSANIIRLHALSGASSNLKNMRGDKLLYVKNIQDTPLEGTSQWLSVKIEGLISGQGAL